MEKNTNGLYIEKKLQKTKVPNAEIIRTVPNLDSWMSLAENRQRWEERGERRVNRGEDGAAVTSWQKQVGNCCNDANRGLGPHLAQGLLNGGHPKVVDDLGSLHHLTGGDVESGHIPANIGGADNRKKSGTHLQDEVETPELSETRKNVNKLWPHGKHCEWQGSDVSSRPDDVVRIMLISTF